MLLYLCISMHIYSSLECHLINVFLDAPKSFLSTNHGLSVSAFTYLGPHATHFATTAGIAVGSDYTKQVL